MFFTFGEADKEGGNETLWTCFIFNVGSSITFFIYGGCKYIMWFLVWISLSTGGGLEYYQVGNVYTSKDACFAEKSKAKTLVTAANQAVHCFEAIREKK